MLTPTHIFAFVAGILAGILFLGALWLTVRGLAGSDRPGILLLFSMTARLGILLLAILWISSFWSGAERAMAMLACLAGFVLARLMASRWVRAQQEFEGRGAEP